MNKLVKLQKWQVAQKRHKLTDKHVQMARELGLNPDKLGKIDNHNQEPWKSPLPQFIEEIYHKRFDKDSPEEVKSLSQILKEYETNRAKKKKEKERKRKAKLENESFSSETKEVAKDVPTPTSLKQKLKTLDTSSRIKFKLEQGDSNEMILQKESHIFHEAFEFYEKEKVSFGELGFILKKIHPPYKPHRYGCKTLGEVYAKFDEYEILKIEGENSYIRRK